LPNAHPGYIPWEEFETNQATLVANANGYGPDRRCSPPREGVAVLQGLAIGGRCGHRMTVRYSVRHGHPVPVYVCQRQRIALAQPSCQTIPGAGLDDAVAQVERAREEAELAQRQFLLVRPEHRLVADSLERQWNETLARLADAEEEYRRGTEAEGQALSADDRARIHGLASDLPRVWHDPRTAMRERKRMLRLLIEDVTLLRARAIQIAIRWKGGATTTVERPVPLDAPALRRTPAAIVEMIRGLATEQTDRQVADTLNRRWLRSGTGQPFRRLVVRHIRNAYGIPGLAEHLRKAGWLSAGEIATQLRLHSSTAKCWAHEGILRAVRADDKGLLLFEPPTGPLPSPQQGQRFRDRRRYPQCAPHVRNEVQYEA
jgi:Recombinase zinc beta ribbon domain